MKENKKAVIMLIALLISLSGCKNNQTMADETLESSQEKERVQELKSTDELAGATVETTPQKEEENDMTKKEEKAVLAYRGDVLLTEDSMVQVLKDFLSIADEEDLKKLEELPLTENFFHQCVEDFPYIENVDEYQEINIEFWSVDENGKCVSLVVLGKEKNPEYVTICQNPDHVYCVEMEIIGDQIDSMKIEFMR